MENLNSKNMDTMQTVTTVGTTTDHKKRGTAAFEFTLPTNATNSSGSNDDDESESNKSTPYYTPMEFFHGTFEFPTVTLEKTAEEEDGVVMTSVTTSSTKTWTTESTMEMRHSADHSGEVSIKRLYSSSATPTPTTPKLYGGSVSTHQPTATSPAVNRKFRRFSLYERRSCSPQQQLLKNASSVEQRTGLADNQIIADKENTKPKTSDKKDDNIHLVSNSDSNSPIPMIDDTSSPKILTASDMSVLASSRLTYSPKLLASINNLNLSGGSPLGVISSAGYKNGNYFKFPEIDHVVEEPTITEGQSLEGESSVGQSDNQTRINRHKAKLGNISPAAASSHSKSRFKVTSLDIDAQNKPTMTAHDEKSESLGSQSMGSATKVTSDIRKNRKNKNNLTIKITDVPCPDPVQLTTPSPKPKTPTVKSTKEKALSLDSARGEAELTIVVCSDSHQSCDDLDTKTVTTAQLKQRIANANHSISLRPDRYVVNNSSRSTSLVQLSSHAEGHASQAAKARISGDSISRTPRRRLSSSPNNDWLLHYRKQKPYGDSSRSATLDSGESVDKRFLDVGDAVILKEDDEVQVEDNEKVCYKHIAGTGSTPASSTLLTAHRGTYKHNAMLHSSSTNLKTLPECLTLVEFTNTSGSHNPEYPPFKQKSMDLPSSTLTPHPPMVRTKHISSTSSTNLLQRRGSNHSLTLNLHGSCSNLLGNCRSGLSISNYSLGSSTTLNSKSSCNLDSSTLNTPAPVTIIQPSPASSQGAKQSLFRRRGSNHSLTLTTNLTATSCCNLNSFASQNSLNVDNRLQLAGVTRTTSFITPTNNTASNVTPKRGLLERRGSNQSLTLNMGSSFSGAISMERNALALSNLCLGDAVVDDAQTRVSHATNCPQANQRKFFSSESLNRGTTGFPDLNQAHRRNVKQLCFGSISDLKPSDFANVLEGDMQGGPVLGIAGVRKETFDFQDSTVCTCSGVRNIITRPLSPQTTSEEFKVYLANIQLLQNSTNALSQVDLVKLNYIFDNSYASNNKSIVEQPLPVLNVHGAKEAETPPGRLATSEDCEVTARYETVVESLLQNVMPEEEEQKRLFRELHKEFWDLPLNHQEKPMVFGSQTKNRYKTILPNENSRVVLDKEDEHLKLLSETMSSDATATTRDLTKPLLAEEVPYINANYIKGPDYTSKCYVATQGPLPNTIYEFWLMIYQNIQRHIQKSDNSSISPHIATDGQQQYYQKIIMLTNFMENNRQKCSVYFPIELNEVIISTGQQEILTPTDAIIDFFDSYVKSKELGDMEPTLDEPILDSTTSMNIEQFSTELSADIANALPKAVNFFLIKNIGIVRKSGFSIRKLLLLYCNKLSGNDDGERSDEQRMQLLINKFYCYHYWYPDWPDHRSPRDINTLLDICLHILNLGKCEAEFATFEERLSTPPTHIEAQHVNLYQRDIFNLVQPLPVIHCSAGIGRTGCLTAILNGIRQLRQSLAHSLTTMAVNVSKEGAANSTSGAAPVETPRLSLPPGMHSISPIDFHLPTQFLDHVEQSTPTLCTNDTDSSFTRNTLLFVHFILAKERKRRTNVSATQTSMHSLSMVELPKLPEIFVDILGIVCNLRLQRGGMVQNSEQYELIHRAICLYLKRTFALKRF